MRPTDLLRRLHRKVVYYPELCPVLGGVNATILFCQLLYWSDKGHDPAGWIYKTMLELEAETGLSRREQDGARAKLVALGLVRVARRGTPARLFYLIDLEAVDRVVEAAWGVCTKPPNLMHGSATAMHETANQDAPIRQINPEPTSEPTREVAPLTLEERLAVARDPRAVRPRRPG